MMIQREQAPSGAELLALARTLMGPARLLVRNHQDAEDLVADTITAMIPRWFSIRGSRTAYARRTLTNRFIDEYRRRSRESTLEQRSPTDVPDPADHLVLRADLHDLLSGLPEQERHIVVLRYALDMSSSAVADALGIPAGTVRRRAHHTLRQLAEQLRDTHDPTTS